MKAPTKRKKPWSAFLLVVLLTLFVPIRAAASSGINPASTGSVTIHITDSAGTGQSLSGIGFTIYQVAERSSSGVYSLTKDFSGSGLQLSKLSTGDEVSAASRAMESFVSANRVAGVLSVTDSAGTAKFEKLPLGYYLVTQTDTAAGRGIGLVCNPFLLAVPMKTDTGWVYDIVTDSKSQFSCGAAILKKINGSGAPLSGAVFRLEQKIHTSDRTSVPSGMQTGSDGSGFFYWNIRLAALTTDSFGEAVAVGLPFGDYRFIETTAPAGYALDSTPCGFSVSAYGSVTLVNGGYKPTTGGVPTVTVTDYPPYIPSSSTYYPPWSSPSSTPPASSVPPTSSVPPGSSAPPQSASPSSGSRPSAGSGSASSHSGFVFPKTGGSVFYAICIFGGILLAACGVTLFVVSRRKK